MSSGYLYGEREPIEYCPYCQNPCRADFVDIGVGYQQCGPYYCEQCGASEIGSYDEPRKLTEDEQRTGWYGPHTEPGSSANVIGGKVVSYKQMEKVYKDTWTGEPLYDVPGEVQNWFMEIRTKGMHQEAREILKNVDKKFPRK